MKLGDLFWVKVFKLNREDYRYKDTLYLIDFCKKVYDVDLTFLEAMTLWECVSSDACAGWLGINCYIETELRDFLDSYFDYKGE